ncbi:CLUMA_CG015726, isoform A [Clunio marinus]|uniref:CLUMA_CG015726, isoform A n=1 Tax=Clunio marinus TaxID=568069 RepID=A0A1J1IV37_9DIPT|nr:CLUMA_CG015726, isoform A [Clunio marinus]
MYVEHKRHSFLMNNYEKLRVLKCEREMLEVKESDSHLRIEDRKTVKQTKINELLKLQSKEVIKQFLFTFGLTYFVSSSHILKCGGLRFNQKIQPKLTPEPCFTYIMKVGVAVK